MKKPLLLLLLTNSSAFAQQFNVYDLDSGREQVVTKSWARELEERRKQQEEDSRRFSEEMNESLRHMREQSELIKQRRLLQRQVELLEEISKK